MTHISHEPNGETLSDFAATHCRQCAAGWTREGEQGGILTVCLLDREPVLADMTSCDRYERKEQKGRPLKVVKK